MTHTARSASAAEVWLADLEVNSGWPLGRVTWDEASGGQVTVTAELGVDQDHDQGTGDISGGAVTPPCEQPLLRAAGDNSGFARGVPVLTTAARPQKGTGDISTMRERLTMATMPHYDWWGAVPDHLVTKTTAAALDMPRTTKGVPVAATVTDRRGPTGRTTYDLFDVTACPPTATTARQLAARAQACGRVYRCGDCGARTERPVAPVEGTGVELCLACRHIARLRATQERLAAERDLIAADLAAVLDGPAAVVVQVDQHVPPLADSGRTRPATASRVRVTGLDGQRLADVTVRLVGPRARWVPDTAVDLETGRAALAAVLAGRRLVVWSAAELDQLHAVDPAYPNERAAIAWRWPYPAPREDPDRVGQDRAWIAEDRRTALVVLVAPVAARWRGVLDPRTGDLVHPVRPGAPDRTALLVATMAGRTLDEPRAGHPAPTVVPFGREGEALMADTELRIGPSRAPTTAAAGRKAES